MSETKRSGTIQALHDGRAGNARQAQALAQALLPGGWRDVALAPRTPWQWWAPRRLPGADRAFGPAFTRQLDSPPALAIGCGRQAALATRLLRGRGALAVQILDPRLDARHWDLVIVPEHDRLRGHNVLTLLGSLHPVDETWLALGRAAFAGMAGLPSPRVALLIGGGTARVPWTVPALEAACLPLFAQVRGQGGSVLATTSRRTPARVGEFLQGALRDLPHVLWRGERDGTNPYAGLLGWADAITCTADSSNLLSEACATAAPVAALFADRARGRLGTLSRTLRERGRLVDADALLDAGPATPLRETARIAEMVRARLAAV
ncbi:MAG TPA: ELM1/GtrOC1 family putative glycosyltransferase [Stenotrophomonas sp.]|jgi:mitochondrial fission protein ELM1